MNTTNKKLWIYLITQQEYMDQDYECIMDTAEIINDDPDSTYDLAFRGTGNRIQNVWHLYTFREKVLDCDEALCFVHTDFQDYQQFAAEQNFDWKPAGLPPKIHVYFKKKENEDYCEEGLEYIREHEGRDNLHFGFYEEIGDITEIICDITDYYYSVPEYAEPGVKKTYNKIIMFGYTDISSDKDSEDDELSNVIDAFPQEEIFQETAISAGMPEKDNEQSGAVIDFKQAQDKSKNTRKSSIESNNDRVLALKRLEEIREELNKWQEDPGTGNNLKHITALFEEAVELCTEYGAAFDLVNMYSFVLDKIGQSQKVYEIQKNLEHWYDNGETEDYETVLFYGTIASLASHVPGKEKEAEDYIAKLTDMIEELDTSISVNRYSMAIACERAGYYYADKGDFDKASEYYDIAIPVLEEIREEGYSCNDQLLKAYHEMCYIYRQREDLEESIKYIKMELDLCKKLAWEQPGLYDDRLAESYINCGMLHSEAGKIAQGIKYQLKAAEIFEKLSAQIPGRYDEALAQTYFNISMDYYRKNSFADSRKYVKLAVSLYENIAEKNPDVKEQMANAYMHMANVYRKLYDMPKYKEALRRSEELSKEYESENSETESAEMLKFYLNTAAIAYREKNYLIAEPVFLKCYNESEKLMSYDPEDDYLFLHVQAGNYLTSVCFELKEYVKAENYMKETLDLTRRMADLDPAMHEPALSVLYYNCFYMNKDEKYLFKAYDIAKKYPEAPECVRIVEEAEKKRKSE